MENSDINSSIEMINNLESAIKEDIQWGLFNKNGQIN